MYLAREFTTIYKYNINYYILSNCNGRYCRQCAIKETQVDPTKIFYSQRCEYKVCEGEVERSTFIYSSDGTCYSCSAKLY